MERIDDIKNHWKFLTNIVLFLASLYVILIIFAIYFWAEPGGYSFWGNFISDLGILHASNGDSNLLSFIIMIFAVLSLSIGISIQYLLICSVFRNESAKTKKWMDLGAKLGIIGSIWLWVLILFPVDIAQVFHSICFILSVLFTIPAIIMYVKMIHFKEIPKKMPIGYSFLGLIYISILTLDIIVPPIFNTPASLAPLMQKIENFFLLCFVFSHNIMIRMIMRNIG